MDLDKLADRLRCYYYACQVQGEEIFLYRQSGKNLEMYLRPVERYFVLVWRDFEIGKVTHEGIENIRKLVEDKNLVLDNFKEIFQDHTKGTWLAKCESEIGENLLGVFTVSHPFEIDLVSNYIWIPNREMGEDMQALQEYVRVGRFFVQKEKEKPVYITG